MINSGGRHKHLPGRLIQRYSHFIEDLPAPLPALAAAHPEFFGEILDSENHQSPPVPVSIQFPFLFEPLFRDISDDVFLEIAAAGAFLYIASVLLDHLVDGEIPDPAGYTRLQKALWNHGLASYGQIFTPEAPFWTRCDRLLSEHASALEKELYLQTHPETFTIDLFREIAAAKTGPAIVTLIALAEKSGETVVLAVLEESVRKYGIALQHVDDLQDWEQDLKNGHLSYILSCILPRETWLNPESRLLPQVNAEISYNTLILDQWRMGIEAFDQALAALHSILCPGWSDQVFLQRTKSNLHWLKTITGFVADAFAYREENLSTGVKPGNLSRVPVHVPQAPPVSRALDAILGRQDPAGAWKEFDIPNARESDVWLTAHIGLKLARLPEKYRNREIELALDSAANFLLKRWHHGWGYNDHIPVDADSTALCLLFLEACGVDPPPSTISALLLHQNPDGGFSTYNCVRSRNITSSWCISAPDITPVVVQALMRFENDPQVSEALDKAMKRMEIDRLPDGTWPAFWWVLSWYTANAWAVTCKRRSVPIPGIVFPDETDKLSNLDRALLLETALIAGREDIAFEQYKVLLNEQFDNGLWPIEPALCQPKPGVYRPWDQPIREIVYPEIKGIYSAATILLAIADYESQSLTV